MIHDVHVGEAFDRFFLAEQPKLVALALAWTGNRELAREIAQEVLLRAYRDWDRVASLDAPGGWAYRVAVNLLIDHRRTTRRRAQLGLGLGALDPAVFDAPLVGPWRDAIASLPDRQRAVVVLHYVVDLSVNDVAAALGIAPGTVKATLSHARQHLRASISGGVER